MFDILESIAHAINISYHTLITLLIIWYLMPIIVGFFYNQVKIGLVIITIFLGWTPLPWIVFFANLIEDNGYQE